MATSAQSGNWNVGSTWVGGVVPTNQAVIANGHVVTVSADATVGTSGISGTVDITVNQGGELAIASSATLTAKGGINVQKGGKYTQNGHLKFNAPTGVEYKLSYEATGSGSSVLTVLGPSPSNRATMRVEGGGTARIDAYSASSSTDVDFENLIVFGFGTSSVKACTQYMLLATTKSRMKNVAFVGCGKVDCVVGLGTQVLDWDIDIRKPLSYSAFGLSGAVDNTTGSRTLKIRCYAEALRTIDLNIRDLVLADEPILVNTQFINSASNALRTSGKLTSFADTVVPIGTGLMNTVAKAAHSFSDVTFLARYDNQHYCGGSEAGTLAPSTWDGVIWDGDGYIDPNNAGDCIMAKDPSTFLNVININKAGTLFSGLAASANITIKNATCYKSFGLAIGETVGSPTQLADLKNVIFSEMERGVYQNSAFVSMTNNPIDYIGFWSMTTAANLDHPLLGVNSYMGAETYAPWFSTGSFDGTAGRGMHDINADPQFKDPSRTIRKWFGSVLGVDTSSNTEWSVTKLGGRLCEIGGVDVDGNIVTPFAGLTPAACRAWIREGFTPQNAVYQGTGEGGADFGAVPVVPLAAVTQPTLSAPNATGVTQNGASFSCSVNKGGTLYYAVVHLGDNTNTVELTEQRTVIPGNVNVSLVNLSPETSYVIVAQLVDTDGLQTSRVGSATFKTASTPVTPEKKRRIKLAKWDMGANWREVSKQQAIYDWEAETFDAVISGIAPPVVANPRAGHRRAMYITANYYYHIPANNFEDMREWAENEIGLSSVDDMLTHISVDYVPQCWAVRSASDGWSGMDKFFAWLGATDITAQLFTGSSNTTLSSTLTLAQNDPYDQLNIDVVTPGVGGSVTLQYWNGAWTTIAKTDGTNNLANDGRMTFTPPVDWVRSKVMGSYKRFFTRLLFTGYATLPVVKTIKADDWLLPNHYCRGWDRNAVGRINIGTEVEYNPNPPAGSSAKFMQQGRVCGYWGANMLMHNCSRIHNGKNVAGQWVYKIFSKALIDNPTLKDLLWDTTFFYVPTFITTPSDAINYLYDIDYGTYPTWNDIQGARFKAVADLIRANFPDSYLYGNLWSMPAKYVEMGHGIELEYYQNAPKGSYPRLIELDDVTKIDLTVEDGKYRCYDGFLPENNPNDIIAFTMYCSHAKDWSATGGHWDRANRSPILYLAKHLIGYNPAHDRCYFLYQHQNACIYSTSDELLLWKYETTLTQALTADLNNGNVTIKGADFSNLNAGITPLIAAPKAIKIGPDIIWVTKVDNQTVVMSADNSGRITQDYPVGTTIKLLGGEFWVDRKNNPPTCEETYVWASHYFPALDVDFGFPDTAGYNGGVRDLNWKTYTELGGPRYTEIWRRDFTNCIVLLRAGYQTVTDAYLQSYCAPIPLGGTYYPLKADGTVGAGITEISLRAAEAAILMKSNEGGVTPEEPTKPTITRPVVTVTGQTTATAVLSCDTTGSTLRYVVSANATEPDATILSGTAQSVTNSGQQTINLTGLPAGSTRYLHVICVPSAAGAVNSDAQHSNQFTLRQNPPVLTAFSAAATSRTSAVVNVTTNVAGGELHALAVAVGAIVDSAVVIAATGVPVSSAGSQSVVLSPLQENTEYEVLLVHVGPTGEPSEMERTGMFRTPAPETPKPVLRNISVAVTGTTTATVTLDTDRNDGPLHYVVTETESTPDQDVLAGTSQPVTAVGSQTILLTGLPEGATRYVFVVQVGAGGASNVVHAAVVTTPAVDPETPALPSWATWVPDDALAEGDETVVKFTQGSTVEGVVLYLAPDRVTPYPALETYSAFLDFREWNDDPLPLHSLASSRGEIVLAASGLIVWQLPGSVSATFGSESIRGDLFLRSPDGDVIPVVRYRFEMKFSYTRVPA